MNDVSGMSSTQPIFLKKGNNPVLAWNSYSACTRKRQSVLIKNFFSESKQMEMTLGPAK